MIILLGAMDGEISSFRHAIEDGKTRSTRNGTEVFIGRLEGRDVALARAGVGKAMSGITAQSIIDMLYENGTPPEGLIFTGLAGAINPELKIGDTLLSVDCIQHDLDATSLGIPRGTVPYTGYRFLEADRLLLENASGYEPAAGRVHRGRILTGDQFIHMRDDKRFRYMIDELKGDAVEMEGAAVALCAVMNSLPFLLIRTISDQADGKAVVKFNEFLPVASENSLMAVRYLLKQD